MSWQEYIDDHLMAELRNGGTLEHAAIASLEGDIWAQSASFPELSESEAQAINAGFDDQVGLASKGLFVGGQKFIVVAGEEGAVIRGKAGQQGITIKKTNTAMVIGIYNSSVQTADATICVENMGDYLSEQGI